MCTVALFFIGPGPSYLLADVRKEWEVSAQGTVVAYIICPEKFVFYATVLHTVGSEAAAGYIGYFGSLVGDLAAVAALLVAIIVGGAAFPLMLG